LKGTLEKDPDMHIYLKKLLSLLFNINQIDEQEVGAFQTKRRESIRLSNLIQQQLNQIIEEKDYFEKILTKSEWFIFLYIIKKCDEFDINVMEVLEKINLDELTSEIKIKKMPIKQHYLKLDSLISEVKK
jgi:hypothetical protein